MDLQEIGERILLIRRRSGLTQEQVAAEAGISASTLATVESGGSYKVSTLLRVLAVCGLILRVEPMTD